MTETTLALCKMNFLGTAMWLSGMCASNQALDSAYLNLASEGEILRQKISVPMDERYRAVLAFTYENDESFERSTVAGSSHSAQLPACEDDAAYAALTPERKVGLGANLKLDITISTGDEKTKLVLPVKSRCVTSWGRLSKSRILGYIDLPKGKHELVVLNRLPVDPEPGVQVRLRLVGIGAGGK